MTVQCKTDSITLFLATAITALVSIFAVDATPLALIIGCVCPFVVYIHAIIGMGTNEVEQGIGAVIICLVYVPLLRLFLVNQWTSCAAIGIVTCTAALLFRMILVILLSDTRPTAPDLSAFIKKQP